MAEVYYTEIFSLPSQIIIGSVLYLLALFGTVGNITLIIALRKNKRLRNTSNLLTISLSASDVLISALAMPISGYAALNMNTAESFAETPSVYNYTPRCMPSDDSRRLTPFLCTLNGLIIYVSSRISTWTLGGMALERYLAVIHPLNYHRVVTSRRMLAVIVVIWIVSLLVELPQVSGWFPFVYYHNAFGCLSPSYHHMGYNHIGFLIFSISKKVLLTLLPTPIIGYCYYKILGVSFKSKHTDVDLKKRFGENDYHKSCQIIEPTTKPTKTRRITANIPFVDIISKTSKKYNSYKKSFIWLIIVISYVICWSPVSVTGIAMNFLDAYCESHFPRGLIIGVFVVAVINSCVNPVIYGFLHHQIRRTFVDIFWCRSTQARLRVEHLQEQKKCQIRDKNGPPNTLSFAYSSEGIDRFSRNSSVCSPVKPNNGELVNVQQVHLQPCQQSPQQVLKQIHDRDHEQVHQQVHGLTVQNKLHLCTTFHGSIPRLRYES